MTSNAQIRLDHSKLYGFKIVSRPGQGQQPASLGAKIGQKGGVKVAPNALQQTVGLSPKIGNKVGFKNIKA